MWALRNHGGTFPIAAKSLPGSLNGIERLSVDDELVNTDPALRSLEATVVLASAFCGLDDLFGSAETNVTKLKELALAQTRKGTTKQLRCGRSIADAGKGKALFGIKVSTGEKESTKAAALLAGVGDDALSADLRHEPLTLAGTKAYCLSTSSSEDTTQPCESDGSSVALHVDAGWLVGQRAAVEALARSATNPSAPSTAVEHILAGFDAVSGLPNARSSLLAESELGSTLQVRIALTSPCRAVGVDCNDFLPKAAVDAIATHVKAVSSARAAERDDKRFAVLIAFTSRDEDQAKSVERDLKDVVTTLRDKVGDNEAKLRKELQTSETSPSVRRHRAELDTFFAAFKNVKVERHGNVTSFAVEQPLGSAQQAEFREATAKEASDPKRTATLDIVAAAIDDKAPPQAALESLVGKPMADYILIPREKLDEAACKTLKSGVEEKVGAAGVVFARQLRTACLGFTDEWKKQCESKPEGERAQCIRFGKEDAVIESQYLACVRAAASLSELQDCKESKEPEKAAKEKRQAAPTNLGPGLPCACLEGDPLCSCP